MKHPTKDTSVCTNWQQRILLISHIMLMWQTWYSAAQLWRGFQKLGFVPRLMQSHARSVFKCPSISTEERESHKCKNPWSVCAGLFCPLHLLKYNASSTGVISQYPIIHCYCSITSSFFIIILSFSDWLERSLFTRREYKHALIVRNRDSARILHWSLRVFQQAYVGSYCKFTIKLYFSIHYLLFIKFSFISVLVDFWIYIHLK